MSTDETIFEERQYLGFNKYSLVRRMVIAIFCFVTYFITARTPGMSLSNTGDTEALIFYAGIFTLIVSAALIFVLHLHTKVTPTSVILDGLWTARKVKIDLHSIESVRIVDYSSYLLNRPVYNLHRKGLIKFYTRGKQAIEMIDKDGLRYIIGSQRASELESSLNEIISKKPS